MNCPYRIDENNGFFPFALLRVRMTALLLISYG
jgi:hypothetical protein